MQKLSAVADECCIYCHANEELFLRMLWYGLLRTFLGTTELLYLSASFTFPETGTPRLVPFVRIFWWYQPAAFQPQICRACWQCCSVPIPLGMVIHQGGCRMGGRCPKFPFLPVLAWKLQYPSVVIPVGDIHGHLDCDISICSFFCC